MIKGNKIKQEKGSATLFVVISMLFLLIVFVSIFINTQNRVIEQKEQVEIISRQYDVDNESLLRIYEELKDEEI